MIIRKEYKFYAAHRNEDLHDKCSNIHGHRYGIICFFEVERTGSISTLFSDFDAKIEPYLKSNYDHAMLINVNDPLYLTLCDHMKRTGEDFRFKKFNEPTSVENLSWHLFSEITAMGFILSKIEVKETDSSVFVYSKQDWLNDKLTFFKK
ncbi:MAG: 6-pyruvoyl trahydropterin synthase family protein [Gemmataceae bacterium]|jgi:6-pyruvoyltetrahydropterin/6-carboxytetrahydropterin synthase